MEGGDDHPANPFLAHQLFDPLLHLAGRLVGEGDRQQLAGVDPPLLNQVGDTVGDHPGLARAGAGQQQQGAFGVANRGKLFLVQGGKVHGASKSNSRPLARPGCREGFENDLPKLPQVACGEQARPRGGEVGFVDRPDRPARLLRSSLN